MNMSDIMLEAFRQEWENLPPKTQQYYIERFREIAGDEPSQEQEPVAWMYENQYGAGVLNYERNFALMDKGYKETPLYTHPAQPLSDDVLEAISDAAGVCMVHGHKDLSEKLLQIANDNL